MQKLTTNFISPAERVTNFGDCQILIPFLKKNNAFAVSIATQKYFLNVQEFIC